MGLNLKAQDTTRVNLTNKKLVEITEDAGQTEVNLLNDQVSIRDNQRNDTTTIRIGHRDIEIIDGNHRTNVNIHRSDKWDEKWESGKNKRFNGLV